MISNQITKFQIKSKSNHTFSKSNHYSSNQIIMCDSIMIKIKSWFGFAHHCRTQLSRMRFFQLYQILADR